MSGVIIQVNVFTINIKLMLVKFSGRIHMLNILCKFQVICFY